MPTTRAAKTATRMDLADAVFHEVGLSRFVSARLVDDVLEEMSKQLIKGETVKISSFGNFAVRSKRARMGRNPKTGVSVPITPRRVLVFRASHILKDGMNGK
jgi:integration host factor subunit alpha